MFITIGVGISKVFPIPMVSPTIPPNPEEGCTKNMIHPHKTPLRGFRNIFHLQ